MDVKDDVGPDTSLELIRLAEVPTLKWLPTREGKPIALSTLHRWVAVGVRGVKLRTVRVGGSRCTARAWLWEFFEALNDPAPHPARRTPRRRERDRERARRELQEAGI